MIDIIKSGGLRSRNEVEKKYGDLKYNHVCLYKKNEEYDYSNPKAEFESARYCWIDNCMVFIVSPHIEAEKVKTVEQNIGFEEDGTPFTYLVDEWRSNGNIPNSKIVGIALPLKGISQYLSNDIGLERKTRFKELFDILISLCKEYGFIIRNSEEKDFTDKMDDELNQYKVK